MKRKNIYIILLLSMFALTSCKVGKSYVRPEMALPDSLAQQQDSMSVADEQWQAVYTDSTLRALIDRALEYNKDMLIAASRVKEMAAQKRISVANLLPQLTGKVEAEREVENYGGHSRDVGNTYEAKALLWTSKFLSICKDLVEMLYFFWLMVSVWQVRLWII